MSCSCGGSINLASSIRKVSTSPARYAILVIRVDMREENKSNIYVFAAMPCRMLQKSRNGHRLLFRPSAVAPNNLVERNYAALVFVVVQNKSWFSIVFMDYFVIMMET